jgi:mono/diheme cytochrome c family protein
MSRIRFAILVILLTVSMVGVGWGIGQWRKPTPDAPPSDAANQGALLFRMHCASCHGNEGRADGSAVAELRPPPRDFLARPWRFDPTPPSIKRVTVDGIPGTSMPSFHATFSNSDLDLVVAHVQELATRGPTIEYVPTAEEKLLRDAGFIDLRGSEAPLLTITDAKGNTTKLSDHRGKLVLLHFWGTSCVHCVKEMHALNDLQKSYKNQMVLLHVCADEDDSAAAQKLLDRLAPGTTAHTDAKGLGIARFEAQTLPTVWLIGLDARPIGRASGAKNWQSPILLQLVEHWLPTTRS